MYELAKVGGYIVSPLFLALVTGVLAAVFLTLGQRRLAAAASLTAFVGLWLASTPIVAETLVRHLESRFPALSVEATPEADAIVVLGGALAGAVPPARPAFNLGPAAGRVWHAAALYRAGKAKWIVVAAGEQPALQGHQIEADAIGEMLSVLGVPPSAIRLDTRSRNTIENAANARLLVKSLKARKVLLVTSALHMPRAMETFAKVWEGSGVVLMPATADRTVVALAKGAEMWLPTVSSLQNVTSVLKELAGCIPLAIIYM